MRHALPIDPQGPRRLDGAGPAPRRASTATAGRLLQWSLARIAGLHAEVRAYLRARATARRERLFDYQRDAREEFLGCATDGSDLERRQRSWERSEMSDAHGWGSA
ncbi:MAG: hypothetical protein ABJC33_04020 [Betaproteobacteria bacterium]